MGMEILARSFIFLGVVLINSITTHRSATKKYSTTRTIGELNPKRLKKLYKVKEQSKS